MLVSLKINNIALISDCEIEFNKGLNVLSGETGAGKSVVLDSINFVLGQKADKSMITYGESQCSATCVFDVSNCKKARERLQEIGFYDEEQIVIKRVFNENGKGSIKLNGETVTASMLRKVTSALVDVHGQSDHFALLNTLEQLSLIDAIGGGKIIDIKDKIADYIQQIKVISNNLSKLGGSEQDRVKRLDYIDYSIKEIEKFNLKEDEEESLLIKRKKLQNAEKIVTAISQSSDLISGENGVSDLLSLAFSKINSLSSISDEYEEIAASIDECVSLIQDISSRLTDGLDEEFDVSEADLTEKRLEDISLLKQKYGKSYAEIMDNLNELKAEYELISKSAERADELKKEQEVLYSKLNELYDLLTSERKAICKDLSKELTVRLKELAMKHALFDVQFEKIESEDNLLYNGNDKVTFMFSANAGEPLKPLDKVISGGELSRLMLAVKSVTANANEAFTYIFDEIDSGISGATASIVAENFAKIALDRQIIAISHLPQIVAMSDSSFLIEKTENGQKTRTNVVALSEGEKVKEVVRLVGGDENSSSALEHATQMIVKAKEYKSKIKI